MMAYQPKRWMKAVVLAAGVYNLLWGLLAIAYANPMLDWFGLEPNTSNAVLLQCLGMMVGVYGVGLLIAARAPYHHWPLILVGLIGTLFASLGFAWALASNALPLQVGWAILMNDLIWIGPFATILWGAIQHHYARGSAYESPEADAPLRDLRTHTGQNLDQLASERPQMVVFLRHAGCTFCREALAELSARRSEIEATGCGIVLVHLGAGDGEAFFAQYGMETAPRISDPQCRLYRQFGLDLGSFRQLFGLRVWQRGIVAGLLQGHGIGWAQGNTFQMPGVFMYYQGRVIDGFLHDQASDRPDYVSLAKEATQPRSIAAAS